MEITETYGFRVSYAEFNGIDDKGNGSISLSSLYTLQSPLSRKLQFVEMLSQTDMHISKCTGHPVHFCDICRKLCQENMEDTGKY